MLFDRHARRRAEIADPREEDASVILLRVIDQADLPNAEEARRVRVETAQRVSGEVGVNWDDRAVMDATTHNLLSYAGIRCRVIGTFYMTNLADAAGLIGNFVLVLTLATTIRTVVLRFTNRVVRYCGRS